MYPKFPNKYGLPAILAAGELVSNDPRLAGLQIPEKYIICFQGSSLKYLARNYRGTRLPIQFGEMFALKKTGGEVGVVGDFGIGAPMAVFILEWLAALGAKQFIVVGFSGGLKETQQPGDLVVCSRALRDEGTSYHYLPPGDYVEPDAALAAGLSGALSELGYAHEHGPTWTTDAPFRETFAEVEHHASNGILTVDMEAAALFAAARSLNLACAAGFSIGDTPKNGSWQTRFDRSRLRIGLEQLADAAVRSFLAP